MAARQSPELVSKLGKIILIALIAVSLIAMAARDPVGMWHLVVGIFSLCEKLINAVMVLFISLIGGKSH
jgi:hypothetical protein